MANEGISSANTFPQSGIQGSQIVISAESEACEMSHKSAGMEIM